MKNILLITALIFSAAQALAFDHTHAKWNTVLQKHVTAGPHSSTFNYQNLRSDRQLFTSYLNELSKVTQKEFNGWDKMKQQAFLMNAYNAFTVKLIVDNKPVDSIKDHGSLFKSPWKKEFFTLLGKKRYLDYVEHEVLRKNYSEPRVHFAVNCASIGCPMLADKAFRHDTLNSELDRLAKAFLTDKTRNRFDKKSKTLYLSKIFKWFKEDFAKKGSTVQKFVAPYMTSDVNLQKQLQKYDVEFLDYDWGLNKTKTPTRRVSNQ